MAPAARRAPTSSTGASSLASDTGRSAGAGSADQPASRRRATRPDDADDDAGDARHEGEPDADGPQIGVEHQQTGPDDVTFTRFGYWAV